MTMPRRPAYVTMLTWGSWSPWDAGRGEELDVGAGAKLGVLAWAHNLRMTNVTHDLVLIFVRMENSDAPPPSVLRALYTAFDWIVWYEEADTRGAFPLPLNDGQRHLW